MQLAATGATVIAVDKNENRNKRLAENLKRTRTKAEVICADLMEWEPKEPVDAILLDAPCTATGTLRRHPDGLWTKKSDDIKAMADIQGTLWHRTTKWVKEGGIIAYCTCSLQPEEGELMLKAFLKGHQNFELVENGELRCLPSAKQADGAQDGFYAAIVRRIS